MAPDQQVLSTILRKKHLNSPSRLQQSEVGLFKKGSREQRESEKQMLAGCTEQGRAPCLALQWSVLATGLCCGDRHGEFSGPDVLTFESGTSHVDFESMFPQLVLPESLPLRRECDFPTDVLV